MITRMVAADPGLLISLKLLEVANAVVVALNHNLANYGEAEVSLHCCLDTNQEHRKEGFGQPMGLVFRNLNAEISDSRNDLKMYVWKPENKSFVTMAIVNGVNQDVFGGDLAASLVTASAKIGTRMHLINKKAE